MTRTAAPAGISLADWLLPAGEDDREAVDAAVGRGARDDHARVIQALGTAARRAFADEVQQKLRSALGDRVTDLLVAGWHAHSAVQAAVRASIAQPGSDQNVDMRPHTIAAHRDHEFDVQVDGVRVLTLAARLEVSFRVDDAYLTVRDGYLVAVHSGRAEAIGCLTLHEITIAEKSIELPLDADKVLTEPIDLRSLVAAP